MAPASCRAGPVLVVIPVLNEIRHLPGVMRQLACDLPRDRTVHFVIADGGSTDGTRALALQLAAERTDVTLLDNPYRIQSEAVNLAVREHGAGHAVLVRCDAHCDYPPGFVAGLVGSLDAHEADAVVVPMDSVGQSCFQRAAAWAADSTIGSGGSAHRGGRRSGFVDHGHHAAFRIDSFRRAGGYDRSYTHNEDAEFDCRQRALGGRIYLDAQLRVEYHPRASVRSLARQYFNYGRGRSRTVRRHPDSWRLRQAAVPAHLVLLLGCLLVAPWWPWALLEPVAYVAALSAASIAAALRHGSWCGIGVGVAAATMHVAWALGFFAGLLAEREQPWRGGLVPNCLNGPATSLR